MGEDAAALDRQTRGVIEISESDALKILDALRRAAEHHLRRDESNAALHMAPHVRHSPLTSVLLSELERLEALVAISK